MLINKAGRKSPKKWLASVVLVSALCVTGTVFASGVSTAHISPGESSETGGNVTATGTNGSLTVSSSGPTYYVQGYAKRHIDWWPDSTFASAIAYPSTTERRNFSPDSGNIVYAEAHTQAGATSIYGEAVVNVN